ncbi:MAG TPA: 3-methyl-2-oxobutanoate hydroxymethyltransferase [Smithellaceae bacterium]|nr:3-methyl-2-oxobutanoate hydroxymethyltransferase [Smithellaceae bacterium]HOD30653.1 3-methyl-2-oxobutanoate hydroxymethyltransferase [Smithellaceae bacterium]HQB92224.1 3-methyl-2-oxobutanoate hydroxymethyltransferase [Smithellaceae bacterium]HQO14628.1 3-methyl-2-oxobutanoate hydroxymethyltransferase [Smithellaceae bacterium]
MSTQTKISRKTILDIKKMKATGEKIAMLTAYDFGMSSIIDDADIDIILVGDSLGNVVLGYDTTLPVTMEDMLHHTKAVARGVQKALLVADMPFMSYQISPQAALANAGRFLQEAGAQAVKLEGGEEQAESIRKITSAGIPVMAHLGLTPQYIHQLGGYKIQGKKDDAAEKMMADAKILEEAGAFSLVLECVPEKLAEEITKELSIPTIGIGAGVHCDGQVLVVNDMLGMYERMTPKFVKKYANLSADIRKAVRAYVTEVKSASFPGPEHSFK